ncbi:MAG: HAMP domain-containing sensor histidine kinase [Bacteroidia bacterium]
MLKSVKPSIHPFASRTFVIMNKYNIRFISVFVSAALIGLIFIQLYWIQNAVKLKEQRFNQDVTEAMNSVAYKMEKQSTASKLTKRFNFRKQGVRWLHQQDSLDKTSHLITDGTGDHKAFKVNDDKYNVRISEQTVADSNGVEVKTSNQKAYVSDSLNAGAFNFDLNFQKKNSSTDEKIDSSDERYKWFMHRSDMVNDIFDELVSINVYNDYSEKQDTVLLDSLLHTELADKGINTKYKFGIINSDKKDSLLKNVSGLDENLINSSFKVNLSPDNMFIKPQFLSVYFPNQENYILSTLRIMLGISAGLILFIIFSFYYTISTILKQKKLSEIKNDFINNMTHEFKTPISTISLACEMLGDTSVNKSTEKTSNYLSMIREENRRLSLLVENILQTAILDKGAFKLKTDVVDVHQILTQVLGNIRLQVDSKQGEIITNLNAENYFLEADKVHLSNIIYNLIDNALKYSLRNPVIEVGTKNVQGGIEISIKDNGIGISKENQKKIFETLYRVPTGNVHNVKGFGLGLSYVKTVVDKHHGTITVESELEHGSTFRIFLPLQMKK